MQICLKVGVWGFGSGAFRGFGDLRVKYHA